MDLQVVFYFIAIFFMIMWVIVLILASLVLWELYSLIKNAPQRIQAAIDSKISEVVENAKSGIVGNLGMSAAVFILKRIKAVFSKN